MAFKSEVEFLQSCGSSKTKLYWSSKPNALWIPLSAEPLVGEPHLGLRTLIPEGEPLQCNYSAVWGYPPGGVGLDHSESAPPAYLTVVPSFRL